ncbi:hypothetical protein [Pseudalkalibacillus hwajinpoensis]|uniref:hypothetical protein n=1 Tax=Guptibacillus hwajinpoensis TaxID=208199 RepID=UPI001CD299CE|nr:hypothetical protein [Pseudalkalibacillus hwajinpoensis]MCA0993365.1 hypothetical protein [Pseudalkalibacillus hwajinpoensis]
MKKWIVLGSVMFVLAACGGGNEKGTMENEPEITGEKQRVKRQTAFKKPFAIS